MTRRLDDCMQYASVLTGDVPLWPIGTRVVTTIRIDGIFPAGTKGRIRSHVNGGYGLTADTGLWLWARPAFLTRDESPAPLAALAQQIVVLEHQYADLRRKYEARGKRIMDLQQRILNAVATLHAP